LMFIIDKPLHGNVRAQEFLDMAMMAAAFDQRVLMVFEGEGAYALLQHQQVEAAGLKNMTPVLSALAIYDINDVLIERESMISRAINQDQLLMPTDVLSRCEIKRKMNAADHVFSF
ncbi:MAG: sulfurtransferase complex subunit TusC, partial [Cycloclasticus sp.]